jgi:glycosyltransferase involved in cell wall biosynthesis
MRPLQIFVTADPELPVPPPLYGGIERVVAQLVDGLVERGHGVTLFAHQDSHTRATLVPYPDVRSRSRAATARHAAIIARAYARRRPDVIHSFGRLAYLTPLLGLPVAKLMSYQRAVTRARVVWAHRLARGSLTFTGCSRRLIEPVCDVGSWHVLYNGVPVDRYRFEPSVSHDAPLVFLGRVERIKGPHVAIHVARQAGRRLVLAGNVPDDHRAYFETEISPLIDGRSVTYAGPVDDEAKSQLLSGAAALLMPIQWDEPFGIVMAEALACGTPVIGLARGAVPEVVDDGVTGFVCGTADAMAQCVSRIAEIDRRACRRAAERRFSSQALVDACEELYGRVGGAASVEPVGVKPVNVERP